MNRFTQFIILLTSSVFYNLYAQSDDLEANKRIISGPIRYVLPENVTQENSSDMLDELPSVVTNSFSIQEEIFNSEGIDLHVLDGSLIEQYNPSINKTAEDYPSLSVYLMHPPMIGSISYSIANQGTWVLPQNWLQEASSRYKQLDEFLLKSGQQAYLFEEVGEPYRYIVSKLEKGDMSRFLYLHSDESGLTKALELAKSLEYSKTGFEQEDPSIENQAVSKIDDLISTPVELDGYQEDGPFSVQFTQDRKFKILHPYAEVGPNVYGAYKTEMVAHGIWKETSYKIFAHYVKTASNDGQSSITEDFDKYFQKRGGERFKTSNMKDGFLIKNSENFEIHLDLSDEGWKEKFSNSDHQPWLHLSVKGPDQDLDHALSVVNSASFSSAINPQKIVLSDFLSENTTPAPIQELENLDQEFPPSPENVVLESEDLYELLREYRKYDKLMIPNSWNWLDLHFPPGEIPIFSEAVLQQEGKFTDDAVNYSKLLYSNLEQRATYQAWVVQNKNNIPPTDMVVERFKTESGFCGVSIHSESMDYYYILLDVTTEERRNDWAFSHNPESVWLLWEFPTISTKEEFEIYRAIVNTYQNRKSQQALPCPPSEESKPVEEDKESDDQTPIENQTITNGTLSFEIPSDYFYEKNNAPLPLLGDIIELKYGYEVMASPELFPTIDTGLDLNIYDFTQIDSLLSVKLDYIGNSKPHIYWYLIAKYREDTNFAKTLRNGEALIPEDWENELVSFSQELSKSPEHFTTNFGYKGVLLNYQNTLDKMVIIKLSEDSSNVALIILGNDSGGFETTMEIVHSIRISNSENPPKFLNDKGTFSENIELTSLGSSWYESDWLGSFFESGNGNWTYHVDMGWVYPVSKGGDRENTWIWKDDAGWLWTSETAYPYLYSDTSKFWIYLNSQDTEQTKYYDYFDDEWRNWGDFPTRTIVEIEGRSIKRILQSDKSPGHIADEIMSILMRGL